jgi:hypothetical protein
MSPSQQNRDLELDTFLLKSTVYRMPRNDRATVSSLILRKKK